MGRVRLGCGGLGWDWVIGAVCYSSGDGDWIGRLTNSSGLTLSHPSAHHAHMFPSIRCHCLHTLFLASAGWLLEIPKMAPGTGSARSSVGSLCRGAGALWSAGALYGSTALGNGFLGAVSSCSGGLSLFGFVQDTGIGILVKVSPPSSVSSFFIILTLVALMQCSSFVFVPERYFFSCFLIYCSLFGQAGWDNVGMVLV